MGFCNFSNEFVISNTTSVDNFFINEFLPSAPDFCVKIYLYGLYKCTNPNAYDNTIESFAQSLGLTEKEIEDAFLYWQDQGLVNVLYTSPIRVSYVPLKNVVNNTKKINKSKYSIFNSQAQEIIKERMITPNEYLEYYTLMEVFHIQPEALLMIMQYCTEIKGKTVGYSYILTVARNWAGEGLCTTEAIEEKIKMLNQATSGIGEILKICQAKRMATVEEQEKFVKWTESWDFGLDVVKHIANKINSKTSKVNFFKLDAKLNKYYELKKFSVAEIEEFEAHKTEMFDIAKQINKTIGVYYENLESIVDVYVSKWLDLGHSKNSLLTLANYCFKNSIRTLDGLDKTILKLYKLGIVSEESIEQHLINLMQEDKQIKEILEKLGLSRNVISLDREFLKTWKYSWFVGNELLDFAIEKSVGKASPMQYINKLLSTWHNQNIKTVEEASKFKFENYNTENSKKPATYQGREYKKEDLNALFDSLEEIEI
ncbi:MAG: DnaD domain protein [Clostridia bacterium]|nr:DnaD domain protein [Clostridia bacterium]